MDWLDKLERKYRKYSIHNLMLYIMTGNLLVFVLENITQSSILSYKLMLIPELVFQGEIWRLITFIFVPMEASPFFILFVLYFYYIAGKGLEEEWGTFKFNLFYLAGMLVTIAVSLTTGAWAMGTWVNLSLFLAYAFIYPDMQILLFMLIPIKIRYIAMFNWIVIGFKFLMAGDWGGRLLALAPAITFFLFFGRELLDSMRVNHKHQKRQRRKKALIKASAALPIHTCSVCGLTDKDDPKMEFRYCSKCTGRHAYCTEHIFNHEHITD